MHSQPTCNTPNSGLTFFPWGGVTSTGISLNNTCPLDNWLMIFQALVKTEKVNLADLPESGPVIATALELIENGRHADGKLAVLQSVAPHPQVVSGNVDFYGNEGDYFLVLLNPYLMNTTTTTCCSATCPSQVHTMKSTLLVLPQPTPNTRAEDVFNSLNRWLYPQDSQCGRKFASRPSERISFYEDATLNENAEAHISWHCAGIRVSNPRTMLNMKSFIIFSVDLLSRGGFLKLSDTPLSTSIFGRNVSLFGATLWNGGHYIYVFNFSDGWYTYDDLKECTRKGSGIWFSLTAFKEPPGYSLSYLVYCI